MFVRKLSFIKVIIISDLNEDLEVYRYVASDMEFNDKLVAQKTTIVDGLRGGMTALFRDYQS